MHSCADHALFHRTMTLSRARLALPMRRDALSQRGNTVGNIVLPGMSFPPRSLPAPTRPPRCVFLRRAPSNARSKHVEEEHPRVIRESSHRLLLTWFFIQIASGDVAVWSFERYGKVGATGGQSSGNRAPYSVIRPCPPVARTRLPQGNFSTAIPSPEFGRIQPSRQSMHCHRETIRPWSRKPRKTPRRWHHAVAFSNWLALRASPQRRTQ